MSSSPSPRSSGDGGSMEQFGEGFSALQQLTLYESRTLMVLLGADKAGRACRLLTLDRTAPCDLRMVEDPCVYGSMREAEARALELIAGSGTPLERTLRLAALLGIIRLPKLFLVVVVKRERVGSIAGRWIYSVSDWRLKAVGHKAYDTNKKVTALTARYKAMILADIELGRDFFFSYFYDLTHTLQHNLMAWKEDKHEKEKAKAAKAAEAAAIERQQQERQQRAEAAAAAAKAEAAAAATAAEDDLSCFDPLAFDPIANTVPQGRRRSTTQLAPPPPPPETGPMLQTLQEEEPEISLDGGSSSTEVSQLGGDLSSELLSMRKGDSSSPSSSYPQVHPSGAAGPDAVAFTLTPAPLDLSKEAGGTGAFDVHSPLAGAGGRAGSESGSGSGSAAPGGPTNPASMPHASEFFFSGGSKPPSGAGAGAGTGTGAGAPGSTASPPTYNEKWLWNLHLAREFLHALPGGSYWLVPLIHGFCQQHAVRIGRKDLLVTLIARRSRHFAGTRFIKRGVSSLGHVANEVESEQILVQRHSFAEGMGAFSSVVMLRGSIPLYFAQENPKSFKPDIVVYNFDRDYVATRLHLASLFQRYGSPVALLSLIKKEEKSPQETRLGMAFNNAVQRVQAQFRMERFQKEMAQAQAQAAAGGKARERERGGSFVREQAARDRLATVQAEVSRAAVSPFPTASTSTPSLSPTPSPLSAAQREREFASTRPPYNHPSYEPNTILMCCYDFLTQRSRQANVLKDLRAIVSNLVEEIGVFTFVAKPLASATVAATATAAAAAAASGGASAASVAAGAGLIPLALLDAPVALALNSTPLQQALLSSSSSSPSPSSPALAASPSFSSAAGAGAAPSLADVAAASAAADTEHSVLSVQKGVIRVNCVDCLDRTNVGQFCIGKAALKIQLRSLGIDDDATVTGAAVLGGGEGALSPQGGSGSTPAGAAAEVYPELVSILQDMYTQHGDRIAHQYAGSGAMHKEIIYDHDGGGEQAQEKEESVGSLEELDRDGPYVVVPNSAGGGGSGSSSGVGSGSTPSKPAPGKNITQNALSAIKRYYSNNFSDNDKQGAINVFLGNYIPTAVASSTGATKPQIWDLDVYTNLMDSDQCFAREEGRFVVPYQPQAIGFVHRARGLGKKDRRGNRKQTQQQQVSRLTAAALGLPAPPMSPPQQQQQLMPNSPDSALSLSPFGGGGVHTPSSPSPSPTSAQHSSSTRPSGGSSSGQSRSDLARFAQYFEEAYNPGVYESFDEELKRAFQTPVLVKTASSSQSNSGAGSASSPALGSMAGPAGPLSPIGEAANESGRAASRSTAASAAAPVAGATNAPAASASASPSPASAPAPAPAQPPAKTNAVKRGFTSLFSSAKASFNAAMNLGSSGSGSSSQSSSSSKADQKQQQQQQQQQASAPSAQPQATPIAQPAPIAGPRIMPSKPAPPLPPKRGASPPIAGAVSRPSTATAAASAPTSATSASGITVSHVASDAGEGAGSSGAVGGVQSLSALVKQRQIAAAVAAISASQQSQGQGQGQGQAQNQGQGAPSGSSQSNPSAGSTLAPPSSAMPVSYPSSFQSTSTSGTIQTGWSPRPTQKRDAALHSASRLSSGGGAAAAAVDAVATEPLALPTAYFHTAADDARALAEYALYCDTGRLFDAPCLPFAATAGPLRAQSGATAEPQQAVPQERLAALLGKAVEVSADGAVSAELSADGSASLSSQELLQASLRLSHEQMADLLVSNVRDLASMHAQLHALGVEAAAAKAAAAASSAESKRLRAAEPFVLPPLDPVASTPEERRADNDFIAQSMMATQAATAKR